MRFQKGRAIKAGYVYPASFDRLPEVAGMAVLLACLYRRTTLLLCDTSIGYLTTGKSTARIPCPFANATFSALTCYGLRFVELTT